jgi:Thioesterase superfamily
MKTSWWWCYDVIFRLTMPTDANVYGNVHGGTILKLIEDAGTIIATRYCNRTAHHSEVSYWSFPIVSCQLPGYYNRFQLYCSIYCSKIWFSWWFEEVAAFLVRKSALSFVMHTILYWFQLFSSLELQYLRQENNYECHKQSSLYNTGLPLVLEILEKNFSWNFKPVLEFEHFVVKILENSRKMT